MPDLCMCTGNCPISEYCYRYMATPNHYGQTYSNLEDVCLPNKYSEFVLYKENNKKEEVKVSYTIEEFILEQIRKNNSKTN